MINLRILVPDDTINYIKNPAFRYNKDDWTAVGSVISRTLDYARFNIASLKVITTGAALREGAYYRVSNLQGISESVTVSAYVRGAGRVHIRVVDNPSGHEWKSGTVILLPNRWQRIEASGFTTGTNDVRLYVETDDQVQSITFYVDGAQMERKAYSTTYCDGDQPDCRWDLTSHASISYRLGNTREGGRWVPLAGPCREENDNIFATLMGGSGMAPISNHTQPWADAPGSFYENQKVNARVMTFSFFVKNPSARPGQNPISLRPLHELRQQLIDLFKADKTGNDQAYLLEYSDTDAQKPLYMRVRYDGGLEGSWDVRNKWVNSFPVRMIAVDPFWIEDTQDVMEVGIKEEQSLNLSIVAWWRRNGDWRGLVPGASTLLANGVRCFAEGPDGTIYIGGDFATPAGVNYVAKWDGTTFTRLSANQPNSSVFALEFGPDGMLYVGGDFQLIGAAAHNRIAKYDPATGTYTAMGTGIAGGATPTVYAIRVGTNGQVYVGGDFTSAGGVNCYRIARWDGLQWRTVGAASGFDNTVDCLARSSDGKTIHAGGAFVNSQGGATTYNHVASIDTDTNLLSQMGYGLNAAVSSMAVAKDGTVYAGGSFTASGAPSADPLLHVAMYSGGKIWFPMGAGFASGGGYTGNVTALVIGKAGEVYAVGNFELSGSLPVHEFAKWYGNNWLPEGLNVSVKGVTGLLSMMATISGDIFLGGASLIGGAYVSKYPKTTVVSNHGSVSVAPIMHISGQATLRYVCNRDTNGSLYLNLKIFSGEDVFIDFARGRIWGVTRGDLSYAILAGSEIRSIFLLPGDNRIAVFAEDEVGAAAHLSWQLQDWSADAIADAPAL